MRDILFRGFHEDPNGVETIFLGGKEVKGEWVYGYYCPTPYQLEFTQRYVYGRSYK